ncbi:hypothetical protein C492_09070 [Natronococcus jeotgali DSM 18795]|uniref:Uncharacterized protein n=1 Tax=Natronococcus jeotgali DSM 18795 TaxID=1227498 RepID=L9XJE2_9EURY|nr:hypothetical protein C492_09070 [Natronococcus jeotgali DSM 18795]
MKTDCSIEATVCSLRSQAKFQNSYRLLGLELLSRTELGEVLNTSFEFINFLTEFSSFRVITGRQLIFESLQSCFLVFFIDIRFPDVLAVFDLIDIAQPKFSYLESLIDLTGINAGDTLARNTSVLKACQYVIFIP